MGFNTKGKVALVTGGASGIGYSIVKALIKCGIKGIVIADINDELGKKVTLELNCKCGSTKIVFQKTDVCKEEDFKRAFEVAIKEFKHIDILFNNAGIMDEVNWDKCINNNLKGVIIGIHLAMEMYLRNYKSDEEALVVNICSISGLSVVHQSGSISWSISQAHYYNLSKTRVIAICPGKTETPMLHTEYSVRPEQISLFQNTVEILDAQSSDFVANETMTLMQQAPSGSIWVIEEDKPAYQYFYADKGSFKNKAL